MEISFELGEFKEELADKYDMLILSPGISIHKPVAKAFYDRKKPVWGEIELAAHFAKGKIAAITGTNGKTTTTALVGSILREYYKSVFVVGNIGIPFTSVALDTTEDSVIVAEMSSFQLETIETFRPRVSAILNITPDHLNRHHTMEAYIAAKENIAKNQTEEDTCVLNYEDAVTRQFGETLKAKVLYFSSQRILEEGIYLDGEKIVLSLNGEKTEICTVNELNILGTHNHENAMAAAAMAAAYGVPVEIIRKTLKEFQGVEHRIEFVAEKDGVVYYNDSKGTNPDAAIKGIQAMNRPTVLIGGGYDKDSAYDEWIKVNRQPKKAKIVVFDLNNLKQCNDTMGHAAGDAYIQNAAGIILHVFGNCGNCYRIGGDEFCVVIYGNDPSDMEELFRQMKQEQDEFNSKNAIPQIQIAYGYAEFDPETDRDIEDTRSRADDKMYQKKREIKAGYQ